MLWVVLGLLGLAAIIAVSLGDGASMGGLDAGTIVALMTSIALLIFLLAGARGEGASRLVRGARDLAIWLAIIFALVAGYGFRNEFSAVFERVTGELAPPGTALSTASRAGDVAVRLRKRPDGHFVARAIVNGAAVGMLVDTGASTVVLRTADAQAAGIDIASLSYSIPVRTANGTAYAAAVKLPSVEVGPIIMRDVEALVARPGALGESLLGMEFLRRLKSYEVQGDYLTLRG